MSRLHRSLLRVLVADIVGGGLTAGERLPTETELAQRFGVSRGVARECLRSLEERGLVAVKHGSGAAVLPREEWDMLNPDVVTALLASDRGSRVLGDYLECRRLLEIEAAGLAAERATGRQLVALSNALDRMTEAAVEAPGIPSAEAQFHEADVAFHRAVIRATGNLALGRMTEPVHRALAAARRPLARPEHRLGRSLPEHREILSAIAARDAHAARAAMRTHLLTVERYLREYEESGQERAYGAPAEERP
jgi:GntR family transcriptional repressor for pyruvate dehydrogenase complex